MSHRGVPLYATCENYFLSSMFVEQRLSTRLHTLQHKDVRVITVFFFVLTCIDQWIVKYRGGKNPHSGCLFLKSSVTEYVTHNSRLISDSHELFLVCFPPFIFSPRWWSNCWETLTESQFSSVLLIELWRVADCSVTCFCEHWHSAALRCPWRPVLMVHFDTWPCCEASECFFGVFFFYSSFCFLCLDFALNVIFQPHLYQRLWCPTVAGLKVL